MRKFFQPIWQEIVATVHQRFHFWQNCGDPYTGVVHFAPVDGEGFCILRRCTHCGVVQYNSFNTFGDKKWHDLWDDEGCVWELEHSRILRAIAFHKLERAA